MHSFEIPWFRTDDDALSFGTEDGMEGNAIVLASKWNISRRPDSVLSSKMIEITE